jgi:hypothetical protein
VVSDKDSDKDEEEDKAKINVSRTKKSIKTDAVGTKKDS